MYWQLQCGSEFNQNPPRDCFGPAKYLKKEVVDWLRENTTRYDVTGGEVIRKQTSYAIFSYLSPCTVYLYNEEDVVKFKLAFSATLIK